MDFLNSLDLSSLWALLPLGFALLGMAEAGDPPAGTGGGDPPKPPAGTGGEGDPPRPEGGEGDPPAPELTPEEKAKLETRQEIVKRFGDGKSDGELVNEVFRSFREIENKNQSDGAKVKELGELIEAAGGAENLKAAIARSKGGGGGGDGSPRYSPEVQKLIDTGDLDPKDPKDAMMINLYNETLGTKQTVQNQALDEAGKVFESGLTKGDQSISVKYPNADLDTIREAVNAGMFYGKSDADFWKGVNVLAGKLDKGVGTKIEEKVNAKIEELKKLGKGSILGTGSGGGGKGAKQQTAREAYDAKCDELGIE